MGSSRTRDISHTCTRNLKEVRCFEYVLVKNKKNNHKLLPQFLKAMLNKLFREIDHISPGKFFKVHGYTW